MELVRADPFRHEAVFYAGEDGFLAAAVPFLTGAVAAREPALVMVEPAKIEALRGALGRDAARVELVDMTAVGANPGRIIPRWIEFVEAHGRRGVRMRGIGEPMWPGRDPDALVEARHHEVLLNRALAGVPIWLACPYDAGALDPATLDHARASHPELVEAGVRRPSPVFTNGDVRPLTGPLPSLGTPDFECTFGEDDLRALRDRVREVACRAAVARSDDLVLAVNEIATNSVHYGGTKGALRVWVADDRVVCEVTDEGHIDDPLAGRIRPGPEQLTGRGLWLAHQLCDLVQVRTSPDGTTVRLHVRRSGR